MTCQISSLAPCFLCKMYKLVWQTNGPLLLIQNRTFYLSPHPTKVSWTRSCDCEIAYCLNQRTITFGNSTTKSHAKSIALLSIRTHTSRFHDKTPYSRSVWFLTLWRHQRKHFPRYWPFVRGIHQWIPLTKASDAELWCFSDLRLNKRLSKQSWGWWFETPSRSLWRHCVMSC